MRRTLVGLGLVGVLVGGLIERRALGPWEPWRSDLDVLTLWSAAAVVVAGLLSLAAARPVRTAAGMLGAAALVPAGIATAQAIGTGLPGPSTGVLAVGLAVVFLGVAARALGPDTRRPSRLGTALGAVGLTVVVAAAAAGVAVVVVELPTRASTAPATPALPVVTTPGEPAWRSDPTLTVRDIRAAGAGVVVADSDGLLALDGTSGAPRWTFRREGAQLDRLAVSPDRTTVVASVRPGRIDGPGLVTVLDAGTGEHRWDAVTAEGTTIVTTDTVVTVAEPMRIDDQVAVRHTARVLRTGEVLWSRTTPPGCAGGTRDVVVRAVVPVDEWCPDGRLRGLDERTGAEVWSLPTAAINTTDYSPVRSSSDGRLLITGAAAGAHLVVDAVTGRLLNRVEQATGFPVTDQDGAVLLVDGQTPVAALDPMTGMPRPLPAGCADARATTVTGTGTLRLCPTGQGPVHQGPVDQGPVDQGPVDQGLAVQVDDGPLRPLHLPPSTSPLVGLDRGWTAFLVPAPGAVVVGTASTITPVVGLAPSPP